MPRSRSVMTNTGVWNFSAKSKASMAMEKHSCGEAGKYMGCLVSPWESSAVEKFKGSELFSGTLNLTGRVEARATKVGADTTLARIVHLVESAQKTKAPIQNLADRFTVWFLPVVLVLAIIVFFVTGNIKTAVSLLLVACPCAFAIATPTAVTAGISNMARRAVLVKGGIFFELAGKIDALVVDKTGTFTLG